MLSGDRLALARLITVVENRPAELPDIMSRVYPHAGRSHVVGLTGPPGAGKSTLTDRLTTHLRRAGKKVGVVAVDPSSPFSGGAVLGDRIRMQGHFLDEGVFIRSLASRGSHGGIAWAARDVVRLLDAFGMDTVLLETVGVGQTELDVMRLAHTTVVVLVPEAGDAIQVMKAGLLEIADVFVVNKADREGADRMQSELVQMLHLRPASAWQVPVLLTQATADVGVAAVIEALAAHRVRHGVAPDEAVRLQQRREDELLDILGEELRRRLGAALASSGDGLRPLFEAVRGGAMDPYSAAVRILGDGAMLERLLQDRSR